MSQSYYEILNVKPNVTLREIRKAFRELALINHPDMPNGNTQRFQSINRAYEVLKNKNTRAQYDSILNRESFFTNTMETASPQEATSTEDAPRVFRSSYEETQYAYQRFKREKLVFNLPYNWKDLNYYEYYNELFSLKGFERIGPETVLNKKDLYLKMNYVLLTMALPDNDRHGQIIEFLIRMFLHDQVRQLYNLSLGYNLSQDDNVLISSVGGHDVILSAITKAPYLTFAPSLYALHNAKILTPDNFKKLLSLNLETYNSIFSVLNNNNLLTQDNFDLLCMDKKFSMEEGQRGIDILAENGLLNQKHFNHFVKLGNSLNSSHLNGNGFAQLLAALQDFSLNTIEIEDLLIESKLRERDAYYLRHKLTRMSKCLTQERLESLHWNPPQPWVNVCNQINQLFVHGLWLLSTEEQKYGEKAIVLALQLRVDLKKFMDLTPEAQFKQKSEFHTHFVANLHSNDEDMAAHRHYSKVWILNILIAFTGIGLFAIGINYLLTGNCFFSKTNRQTYIEEIENNMLFDIKP
jgi:hypothetical protein